MTNAKPQTGVQPEKSSFLDQAYTCSIIALGLTLLGLALFRPEGMTSLTEAVISYQRLNSVATAQSLEDGIENEIKSRESLGLAVAGIPENVHPELDASRWSTLADQIADSLLVSVDPAEDGQRSNVVIRCSGSNEGFQWQLLNNLQQNFISAHHKPVDRAALEAEYRTAQERVAAAIEILDFAQARLDDHVASRLAEERNRHQSELDGFLERSRSAEQQQHEEEFSALPSVEHLTALESVNPNWSRLHNRLDKLRSHRTKLLQTDGATIDAESLESVIRQLEYELETTPQRSQSPVQDIQNPFVESLDSDAATVADEGALAVDKLATGDMPRFDEHDVRQAILGEPDCRQLIERVEQAKQEHASALDAFKSHPAPSTVVSESATVVRQPTVVRRTPTPLKAGRFLCILTPSVLVGLICAFLRTESDPPDEYVSPQDVEDWLELPVVGAVSTNDGPLIPAQEASRPTAAICWCRRTAEVVVCASLVLIIVSMATDSSFKRLLINDPFTAYTQAVDKASDWFG